MNYTDLMNERRKVCMLYPNCPFKIGEILHLYKFETGNSFFTTNPESLLHGIHISYELVNQFQDIFMPLRWYYCRNESEMPTYLKTDPSWEPSYKKYMKYVGEVIKPFKIVPMDNLSHFFEKEGGDMKNLAIYIPATEKEFLDYQNKAK